MSEEIGHNCGLCVIYSLRDTYYYVKSLQHRRREATGSIDDSMVKWNNSKRERALIYSEAGAEKVYHVNCTLKI